MFSLPRKIIYEHNLKSLAKNLRFICSDQSQHVQVTQSFNESDSKSIGKKKEYGEKEIFLLHPTDSRTPLPGNTGVVPLPTFTQELQRQAMKYNTSFNSIFTHSPEERQKNTLAQLAVTAVESILSSASTLECTIHECPQLLKNDFSDLFPFLLNMQNEKLVVMTLCQKTDQDMKSWSEDVENERATLEECFNITARAICSNLKDAGYWADFIHPSTGKPVYGSNASKATFFETDIRYSYFGFTIEDLGCCKVISHNLWGTKVFVGAIFTNAPLDSYELQAIMSKYSTSTDQA